MVSSDIETTGKGTGESFFSKLFTTLACVFIALVFIVCMGLGIIVSLSMLGIID